MAPDCVGDDVSVYVSVAFVALSSAYAPKRSSTDDGIVCGSGSPSALAIAARSFATSSALLPLVASSSSSTASPGKAGARVISEDKGADPWRIR